MKTSTTAKTADIVLYAIENVGDEYHVNVESFEFHHYIWAPLTQKGSAMTKGMKYLREGVLVKLTDAGVVIRQVADNGLNAGEITLTGFATRSVELIQGAIETALEMN